MLDKEGNGLGFSKDPNRQAGPSPHGTLGRLLAGKKVFQLRGRGVITEEAHYIGWGVWKIVL